MPFISSRSTFAAFALLAITISPTIGHADEKVSTAVNVSDLDLKTDQGVAALHNRIADAAVKVCGRPEGRSLADSARVWDCREAAISQAASRAATLVAEAQHAMRYVAAIPASSALTAKTAQ